MKTFFNTEVVMCAKLMYLILLCALPIVPVWAQDSLNVAQVGHLYGQVSYGGDIAVSGNHIYVDCGDLAILEASNPQSPTLVGYCGLPGYGGGVAVEGNYAYYAAGGSGLWVVDISSPERPREVGFYELPWNFTGLAVFGQHAYVSGLNDGVKILDVSDPYHPVPVGLYQTDYIDAITVSGSRLYVGCRSNGILIRVVDVSHPAHPVEMGYVYTGGFGIKNMVASGNYLYVAADNMGLRILNVTDPANPTVVGGLVFGSGPFISQAFDVAVSGQYAYVGVGESSYTYNNGLRVVNVSNPAAPVLVGSCSALLWAYGVAVSGSTVYACGAFTALQVINVASPSSPTAQGHYSVPGNAQFIAQQGNYAYVADWNGGFKVVDLTNPAAPQEVGAAYMSCFCVAINGNYAFTFEDDVYPTFVVLDVSNPAAPTVIGYCEGPYGGYAIAAAGNYVYVSGGQLWILDVSTPTNPVLAGQYNFQAPSFGLAIAGNYAYVAALTSLRIVNIANPAAPVEVGFCAGLDSALDVAISGNYAYLACGPNGLRVVNIANPSSPVQVSWLDTPGDAQNITVSGNYAYLADGYNGVQVVNISNPAIPIQSGYYNMPGMAADLVVSGSTICTAEGYRLGVYQFTAPTLDVALIPTNPPIIIPANGGSFVFDAAVINTGATPQSFYIWTRIRHPLIVSPVVYGPFQVNPPPGTALQRTRTQNIPGTWPSGQYSYTGYAAWTYPGAIVDSSFFYFTKSSTSDGGPFMTDAACLGEPFPGEWPQAASTPAEFSLSACPNPFNPISRLSFDLPQAVRAKLSIFDVNGRLVATLVDGWLEAGSHEVHFNATNLASGIYLARLQAASFTQTQKLVLLK
jgi:hypothetical protein